MELWTVYEGRTIDGAFPLNKLVLPQGRSAFFSTANGKGEPILIRLVACHFDEDEILARWRGVQALNHPNFLRLERYGQLEMDDTRVVYAAFERTDGNLAEVLTQGRLTVADARQLAASLASAIEMLHANGFVHEHIDSESVFAVGEIVKLRTDCIRETPEGPEGYHAKRRDVRDLAAIVLQALTQERTLEAAAARRRVLPAPFDQFVPNAISGEWGLSEITAALRAPERPSRNPSATATPARTTPPQAAASAPKPAPSAKPSAFANADAIPAALRTQHVTEAWRDESLGRKKWIGAAALAAVMILLLWVGWNSVYRHPAKPIAEQHASPTQPAPLAHRARPSRAAAAPARPSANNANASSRVQWRVVAYTYNRQEQAEKKSAEIAQQQPGLRPAVFSPSGHAPFLVTIGGAMDRNDAYALARRSRNLGMPRDTYAQNYKSKAR
jgi:hypothetical protein